MAMGTDGVARFFAGVAAGPALRQRAAMQGRLDAMREAMYGARINDDNAEAGLRQNKLDALDPDTLATSLAGMGVPQDQSGGVAGLVRAGQNVSEVGALMKALQTVSSQRAARDAAINGNPNLANANLFGVADKPVDLSKVVDGVALNPTVTPDQNSFDPTAVGQAMIAQRNAAADASEASAARQRAGIGADKAGNYDLIDTGNGLVRVNKLNPSDVQAVTLDGKPVQKAGAKVMPPISDVTAILPKTAPAGNPFGQPVTNPTDVATALAWLAQNPGKNVGDYVTQAPVGSPGTVADHGNLVVPMPTGKGPLLATKAAPAPAPAEPETPAEDAAEPGEEGASGPAMPKSQADFDALPKGALFINPADGQLRRKK